MMKWPTVRPNDKFRIIVSATLDADALQRLMMLYQPLIESHAVSLYLTLMTWQEQNEDGQREYLYHDLMVQMHLPLSFCIEARERLEAVGLLRTYKADGKDGKIEILQLLPPYQAEQFFDSDVLKMVLLNRLGRMRYAELYVRFRPPGAMLEGAEEVTKSFDQVFQAIRLHELAGGSGSESGAFLQQLESSYTPESASLNRPLALRTLKLDWEMILAMVGKVFKLKEALDEGIYQAIEEISFLYGFTEEDWIDLLQNPIVYQENGKINLLRLRSEAKARYRASHHASSAVDIKPRQDKKTQTRAKVHQDIEQTTAAQERHRQILREISPLSLLKAYQGNGKLADADINLVESLSIDFKLKPEVINVLIEYIMFTNQYKLPRALVEKVAAHWKRLNIETAEAAMATAKREHRLYQQWQPAASRKKKSNVSEPPVRPSKTSKLPTSVQMQLQEEHQADNGEAANRLDPMEEILRKEKEARTEELLKELEAWKA